MKGRVLSSRIIHTDDTQVKLIDADAGWLGFRLMSAIDEIRI